MLSNSKITPMAIVTAQTMADELRIYYNFLRPHTALDGKTPAQKANIQTDGQNGWIYSRRQVSVRGLWQVLK